MVNGCIEILQGKLANIFRKPTDAALIGLALMVQTVFSAAPEVQKAVPQLLAERGVTVAQFDALKAGQIISPGLHAEGCGISDSRSLGDKLILSDLAVRGTITDIEYLYKEGGPYRTLYTLQVQETLKGNASEKVQVLSPYGPNSRDHRRWKTDPAKVWLEKGDQGIFLLTNRTLLKNLEKAPAEVRPFLKDKYFFQRNMAGVYILNGNEADTAFLVASGKTEASLSLAEIHATSQSLHSILESDR